MKGWRVVGLALAVMLLFGSASKMNQVQLGMTRDQVLGAIGSPSSTSEMGGASPTLNTSCAVTGFLRAATS